MATPKLTAKKEAHSTRWAGGRQMPTPERLRRLLADSDDLAVNGTHLARERSQLTKL